MQYELDLLVDLWSPMLIQDGKTDYKSVTVASNATAEEFIDFYFDDVVRMKWVRSLYGVRLLAPF